MINIIDNIGSSYIAESPRNYFSSIPCKVPSNDYGDFEYGIWGSSQSFGGILKLLSPTHNELDGVSNLRHLDCLHNRLFRRRSKKTSKLRITGLCEGNSPVTGEFPAQRASDTENVSIWWRHREILTAYLIF